MSDEQPVAWANEDDDGVYEVGLSEAHALYALERARDGKLSQRNPRVAPLYRSPTLTDEEREALEWAEDASNTKRSSAIRALIKRLG
jgi:hypothetical protein